MIESITWYLNNIKKTLLKFQEHIYGASKDVFIFYFLF
jgi:hypothetical protein